MSDAAGWDESIGEKHAIIDRVYNATTKTTDHYTAGGGFKINGQDLGQPDLASSTFGLFLESVATGTRIKLASIIDWTDGEITGAWPAGVTGAQRLVVVTQYAFCLPRTTIYGTNLTPQRMKATRSGAFTAIGDSLWSAAACCRFSQPACWR